MLKHLTYRYGVNMIMPHLCTVGSTGGRVVCPIDDSLNNRSDGWTLAKRNHLERGSDEKALPRKGRSNSPAFFSSCVGVDSMSGTARENLGSLDCQEARVTRALPVLKVLREIRALPVCQGILVTRDQRDLRVFQALQARMALRRSHLRLQ